MATERQVRETVERCVATMDRYHDNGPRLPTTMLMVAEVQIHAAWVLALGMRSGEVVDRILRPVEARVLARYGPELGVRLNAAFLDALYAFHKRAAPSGANRVDLTG